MSKKTYVAKTIQGLEQVLADELKQCGVQEIRPGRRMVEFETDIQTMYSLNYRVYTALRILESYKTFTFTDVNDYYSKIRALRWDDIISADQTIAVDASVFKCNAFNNSHFTEMKTKDAVADYFRDKTGKRPSVSLDNPDLVINIYIQADFCHVSLDTSGTPLYKRGYREVLHEASLNEVLAAGLIRLSKWNGKGYFYDPMCGGCTIPIEAAMFAMNMPAGYFRQQWGFMNWKNFQPELWKKATEEFSSFTDKGHDFQIIASDSAASSLRASQKNLARSRMVRLIKLEQKAFEKLLPAGESGILIFNPPYNVRLHVDDITGFYQEIGNHLKHNFSGHDAWIISSDLEAIKYVGLKPTEKHAVWNGPLEARYHKFSLFEGKL